jgi:hypothetical protein
MGLTRLGPRKQRTHVVPVGLNEEKNALVISSWRPGQG